MIDRLRMGSRPLLVVLVVVVLVDAVLPPRYQPSAWILRGLIRAYQVTLSPILGATGLASCRFQPTCSEYAAQAVARYGTWSGGARAAWRVLRCNPWGGSGWDPP